MADEQSNPEGGDQEKGFGLSSYGNSAGDKVQSALSPVGKPLGTAFEKGAAPVGSIVGSVVDNGIMAGGRAAGAISGAGAGGMDTGEMKEGYEDAKKQKKEQEDLKAGIGGKEQTGDNPLGL